MCGNSSVSPIFFSLRFLMARFCFFCPMLAADEQVLALLGYLKNSSPQLKPNIFKNSGYKLKLNYHVELKRELKANYSGCSTSLPQKRQCNVQGAGQQTITKSPRLQLLTELLLRASGHCFKCCSGCTCYPFAFLISFRSFSSSPMEVRTEIINLVFCLA